MTIRVRVVAIIVIVLVILIGAGNLFATAEYVHSYKASQQKQGQEIEQRLCATLGKLASLTPPPGNPKTNPSRAYDQQLHAALAQLGTDLGCPQ